MSRAPRQIGIYGISPVLRVALIATSVIGMGASLAGAGLMLLNLLALLLGAGQGL